MPDDFDIVAQSTLVTLWRDALGRGRVWWQGQQAAAALASLRIILKVMGAKDMHKRNDTRISVYSYE